MDNGTYYAKLISHSVGESKNGSLQLNFSFSVTAHWNGDTWDDYGPASLKTAMYPLLKTGLPNVEKINGIVAGLGIPHFDLEEMADGRYAGTECLVVVENEEYNGKNYARVNYINHRESDPNRGDSANRAPVQDILQKYKGLFGTAKPKNKPPVAAKSPAPQAPQAASTAARTPSPKADCYQLFVDQNPGKSDGEIKELWIKKLADFKTAIGVAELTTPEQWSAFRQQIDEIPF